VLVFWQASPRIQVILKDGLTAVAGRRIQDVGENLICADDPVRRSF
jgi:hypothetical protein